MTTSETPDMGGEFKRLTAQAAALGEEMMTDIRIAAYGLAGAVACPIAAYMGADPYLTLGATAISTFLGGMNTWQYFDHRSQRDAIRETLNDAPAATASSETAPVNYVPGSGAGSVSP